ncbi:hypothetical protein [Flagellimonas marinaquae]
MPNPSEVGFFDTLQTLPETAMVESPSCPDAPIDLLTDEQFSNVLLFIENESGWEYKYVNPRAYLESREVTDVMTTPAFVDLIQYLHPRSVRVYLHILNIWGVEQGHWYNESDKDDSIFGDNEDEAEDAFFLFADRWMMKTVLTLSV